MRLFDDLLPGLALKMLDDLCAALAKLRRKSTTILLVDQMVGVALCAADRV
jgi:ABC-type branched-subunit amino acid transport system ATPase component